MDMTTTFCVKWRNEVCQTLTLNPLGILQCKYHELAHIIQMTMDFPNPLAIASYLGPLTSWSNDQPSFDGIVSSHQPDVTTIARFCTQHFFLVCGDSPGQNVWCLDGCSHLIILPGK